MTKDSRPFPSSEEIKRAAGIIRSGGLVSFPTETVYGLGADALNPVSVARIFDVKNRPLFDPLIVHVASLSSIIELTEGLEIRAEKLIKRFMPGPLTLVLPKSRIVPDIVTSGLPTVAVRMPDHKVALELIHQAGVPIAAPSANPFGYLSPTTACHVKEQLGEKIDMLLDGGSCILGVESTIIKLDGQEPLLLRYGGLPVEEIKYVIGQIGIPKFQDDKPESPGHLPCHYSPHTAMKFIEDIKDEDIDGKKAGLLAFEAPRNDNDISFESIEVLSKKGDLIEAAANLFSALHRLDSLGLDIIIAETFPLVGLGRAIMDRLQKAVNNRITVK